jgi:membrane protein DedA with SNARE-associated domain
MTEQVLQNKIMSLITNMGDLGVFLGMLLESSIVPIPSEVIIIGAGAIGIPILSIVIFGAMGSTIGGLGGYLLGRYAAMPIILKYGKFVLIKPHHIYKTEEFAKKYGVWSVLIGRVLPVVPFKVFSIAAGITRIPIVPFTICTLVGVVPRIFILSIFGTTVVKYTRHSLMVIAGILLIFIAYKISRKFYAPSNNIKRHDDEKDTDHRR